MFVGYSKYSMSYLIGLNVDESDRLCSIPAFSK